MTNVQRQAFIALLAKLSGELGAVRRLCEATGEACMAGEVEPREAQAAVSAMVKKTSEIAVKLQGIEVALAKVH